MVIGRQDLVWRFCELDIDIVLCAILYECKR